MSIPGGVDLRDKVKHRSWVGVYLPRHCPARDISCSPQHKYLGLALVFPLSVMQPISVYWAWNPRSDRNPKRRLLLTLGIPTRWSFSISEDVDLFHYWGSFAVVKVSCYEWNLLFLWSGACSPANTFTMQITSSNNMNMLNMFVEHVWTLLSVLLSLLSSADSRWTW